MIKSIKLYLAKRKIYRLSVLANDWDDCARHMDKVAESYRSDALAARIKAANIERSLKR